MFSDLKFSLAFALLDLREVVARPITDLKPLQVGLLMTKVMVATMVKQPESERHRVCFEITQGNVMEHRSVLSRGYLQFRALW